MKKHLPWMKDRRHKFSYSHSVHLTEKQVLTLFGAAYLSVQSGQRLNRHMVFHIHDFVDRKDPQAFVNMLFKIVQKWYRQQGIKGGYVWVLENAPIKGIHLHVLIHIPSGLQVSFKQFLSRGLNLSLSEPFFKNRTISLPRQEKDTALCQVLRYLCKGINPQVSLMNITPQCQGLIFGRRCGHSRNLQISQLISIKKEVQQWAEMDQGIITDGTKRPRLKNAKA